MGSNGKTIVVLGAGVGGLVTANELRKKLGSEHRVIIIDKSRELRSVVNRGHQLSHAAILFS